MRPRLFVASLLALLATVFPLHGQEAPDQLTDEQQAECQDWYHSRDFVPLGEMPLVRVATGSWWGSGGEKNNSFLVAFLKDVEEDGRFTVTTLFRVDLSFTPTGEDVEEHKSVGFENLDFEQWLDGYLKNLDDAENEGIFRRNELTGGGSFTGSPTSTEITYLHLAMECEARGHHDEARRLMDRLPRFLVQYGAEDAELPFVEKLERAYGHLLMWQAVVACDHPANSRTNLLKRFREVVRIAPRSRHAPQAGRMAERLEKMIGEDRAHAERRKERTFDELSKEEQIADLVFRLRDQDGAQWSQPGSCSIFIFGEKNDSPAQQLVEIGFDAIPQLIDALLDENLTYSVEFHRNFYFSHRVLTVGDAAEQIIEQITGTPLPEAPKIQVFGDDPEQDREHRLRAAKQKAALDWWLEFEERGERQFLIDAVTEGGQAGSNLAPRLAERYPEDALEAMKAGLERSSEAWVYSRYVRAIGHGTFEENEALMLDIIEINRFPEGTLAALEWLARHDPEQAAALASELLDQEETWQIKGAFGERFADDLLEFLVGTGNEAALQAIVEVTQRMNIPQRVEVATEIFQSMDEDTPPAVRNLAERILVSLLTDRRRRTGMSGSVGDLSYSDPRVCDLAAAALAHHWPTRHKFDYKASVKIRNRQITECANRWRKENGEPLLEHDERMVHRMSQEAFAAMAGQHGDLANPENLEAFIDEMKDQGPAILEPLIAYTKQAPETVRKPLESLTMDLANRVERITLLPEGLSYPPVTQWIEHAESHPLDGESVVALMSSFFRQAEADGEPVRGIEFEALRHGDLTGIDVNIRLTARERLDDPLDQWDSSESVSAGNESVHTAGYGGGLSKDDPEDSVDLREGVDQALATPPGTPCEIRWHLTGWWHDD